MERLADLSGRWRAWRLRMQHMRAAPEDSVALRTLVFVAQAASIFAVAMTARIWPAALLALLLLGVGHLYAYRVRESRNRRVRLLLFVLLHLTFCWMFVGLFTGQAYPQAQAAVLVMAVVSWDLYSRLNLYSGFGFALGNLYVAATLSRDTFFALFLLIFFAALLAFLWGAERQDGLRDNPVILQPVQQEGRIAGPARWGMRLGLGLLIAVPLVFVLSPRYAGIPPIPPFSLRAPLPGGPQSQIVNPALPLVQIEGWSNGTSAYYYGFDTRLDLSYRGGLSDTIMMYVRSPARSYWRSHAYDYYDGRTWVQSDPTLEPVESSSRLSYQLREWPEGPKFVQSFYIMQPMPNLVFVGGEPVDLVILTESLSRDSTGGLRLGSGLEPGMSYSVLSVPQNYEPDELQQADTVYPAEVSEQYLQIPDTVTPRTRELARRLTAGKTTVYEKVMALQNHLLSSYPYDLYPPPQAPGADAVDQFLFEDQRGVCEQYVSAHVIMLRSLGIPARLVSGFGSGDYNAVTGYYEVRANDAHAWTEVYFPGYGWVSFDPTPGWSGFPQTGPIAQWIFGDLTDGWRIPTASLGAAFSTGLAVAGAVLQPVVWLMTALLLGGLVWAFIRWVQQRQRKRRQRYPHSLYRHPARKRILKAYYQAQRRRRHVRAHGETVQEHARAADLTGLADLVDVAAYRPEPPDEEMVREAELWRRRDADGV